MATTIPHQPVFYIPLATAALCVDCDSITAVPPNFCCAACGSHQLLPLAPILNRTTTQKEDSHHGNH